jgi:hypothetical protein
VNKIRDNFNGTFTFIERAVAFSAYNLTQMMFRKVTPRQKKQLII